MTPPLPSRPVALPLALVLLVGAVPLGACGGSDGGSGREGAPDALQGEEPDPPGVGELPAPEAPADASSLDQAEQVAPPEIADAATPAGLRLVVDGACGSAGEEIVASLFLNDASGRGEGAEAGNGAGSGVGVGTNVTAFASFDQGLGDSVELVSRTDDAIRFRLGRPDVVALTATLEGATLTRYFGAWPDGAPAASALRKRAPAGCLWSLRLPPLEGGPSFCGSAYSRGAPGRLGLDDRRLDVAGCESTNGAGLEIIELEPVE